MFKLSFFALVILVILVIIFAPLAYIWALNTLFPMLNLEYSFVNWVAICLLHSFFHQNITVKK
jgi:hypothetical protein